MRYQRPVAPPADPQASARAHLQGEVQNFLHVNESNLALMKRFCQLVSAHTWRFEEPFLERGHPCHGLYPAIFCSEKMIDDAADATSTLALEAWQTLEPALDEMGTYGKLSQSRQASKGARLLEAFAQLEANPGILETLQATLKRHYARPCGEVEQRRRNYEMETLNLIVKGCGEGQNEYRRMSEEYGSLVRSALEAGQGASTGFLL